MIEIGQNLKDVLKLIIETLAIIAVLVLPIHLILRFELKDKELEKGQIMEKNKRWWSIDNPIIYIIASIIIAIVLAYAFKVK